MSTMTATGTMVRRTSNRRKSQISTNAEKRSGLEDATIEYLRSEGVDFEYEAHLIPWVPKVKTYKPDFFLSNGIIIETKGQFDSDDRTKMKAVKTQHPQLDIRMVFSNGGSFLTTQKIQQLREWWREQGHGPLPITGPVRARAKAAFFEHLKAKGERVPSATTYGDWCDKHSIPWANKLPPRSWLREPPNERSLAALKEIIRK